MRIVAMIKAARSAPDAPDRLPALAPCDGAALAWAIRLGALQPEAEVVVLTAGPQSSDAALERALELGAHRAVRVWVPEAEVDVLDGNVRGVTELLTATLRHLGTCDLLLTGARSADWSSGITGPAVAFELEIPHVTLVSELTFALDEGGETAPKLRGEQLRGKERLQLEIQLPALLTVCTPPQEAPKVGRREGTQIEVLSNDDVGFEVDDPLPWPALPVERTRSTGRKLTSAAELLDLLPRSKAEKTAP